MKEIREWLAAHPVAPPQAKPRGIEISFSQIQAYLRCPWLYKIRYVDRRRASLTPQSSLGLSIHRALEAFHREDSSTVETLLELYDQNWLRAGYASVQEEEEWRRKGKGILRNYWKDELNRRSQIVAVEKDFLFPLGPHQVRGTIDRVDRRAEGEYEVIDYKTHLGVELENEVAQNLQLGIYALGIRESLGWNPSWLSLYYVALGRRVTVPYNPARDQEILDLVFRVADLIAAHAFKPDTSYCPSCDFRDSCPHSIAKTL